MKHYLLTGLLFISFLTSYSQKEANVWYFGRYAGVDFNSGSPVALTNGKLSTNEGCAAISDKTTGQVLFYTDGITAYDHNNNAMPNGTGLMGDTTTTQSGVIVPMPGSTTKYYLFAVGAQAGYFNGSDAGVTYSIVDMTLNGGNGDVDVNNKNKALISPTCEKLAAVRHCDGKDIWVIVHQWNTDAFYSYLLTGFGITAPIITHVGIVHSDVGSGQNAESIGYMKFSPDGTRLAVACYENLNTVQIFDFNNQTGVMSNPITDNNYPNVSGYDGPYGLSFSPDNSRLYVGVYGYTTPSYIYQYNLQAGNAAAVVASRTQIVSRSGYGLGALQNAPDGKMYVAEGDDNNGFFLDVIKNPNALGTSCNYSINSFSLAGKLCMLGLPDFVEGFLATPYTATLNYPICTGNNTLNFVDNTINGNITVYWDFGDPSSGVNDNSALQNPTHSFSSSGSYTVTLYVSNDCITDTIIQTVNVTGGNFTVNAGADVSICTGDSTQLNVTGIPGGSIITWSPTTGLSCNNCANPKAGPSNTSTYIVTVNSGGCVGQDTVVVTVSPTLVATAGPDTTVCAGSSVQLHAGGGTTYSWSPGSMMDDSTSANPNAFTFVTTTYTVTVSGGSCGTSTATVTVNAASAPPVPNITQSSDTLFCSYDPSYSAYQWYFNSTPIPGATKSYFLATQNGNYNVAVTNENGCSVSVGIIILGVESYGFRSNSIYLVSNSLSGELSVNGNNLNGKLYINIYDALGQSIYYNEAVAGGSFLKNIDISKLAKGVYFVEIQQPERKWVGKFEKE